MYILRIPQKEEKKRGRICKEIRAVNVPKLKKKSKSQIQKHLRVLN